MIPITAEELRRWRAELDLGITFRDEEFGTYRQETPGAAPTTTLAGLNIEAFEQGGRLALQAGPPLNLVFALVNNIVPTLFFQNPRVTALPELKTDTAGEDAFYVAELLNRDLRDPLLRIKETGQQTTKDGYLLASGLVKIGYATEFGADILPTEVEERKKLKDKLKAAVEQVLVGLQLKKPPEPEPELVHEVEYIRSECPYIQWISPFDFVIDPRARDITDARWVAQCIRRTLRDVKADRRYGPAKKTLRAEAVETQGLEETFIEDFQTIPVWEIHYKNPDAPTGITILTIAATQAETTPLMHEHNVYDLGGWQYEWLTMNKHWHRLYPVSTISILRPLLDRINDTFIAILEQVDKFQTKIAHNERVTPEGIEALDSAVLGARVKLTGQEPVTGAIAVIAMPQVASDMLGLVNQVLDFVVLLTGLTRAQLTGLTTAQTATEAQIGQSGQNLRRTDEANVVSAWFTRALTKYWRVKAQFQDLTQIALIKESGTPNPQTGLQETQWHPPIDDQRAERLRNGRFRFELEVSSMQKPNLEIIRAQFEQYMRALMEPIVTQGLALEGKRVSASEAVRQWNRFFEEYGLSNLSKLIVPVQDPMMQQALLNYGQSSPAQGAQGKVPNHADLVSAAAGEKGQGVPRA